MKWGASLVAPPFTRQWNTGKDKNKRLNVKEIQKTRLIARLRIHVERAIEAYQQGTKFPIAIKQKSGHINMSIFKTSYLIPPLRQPTPCHCMTLATPPPLHFTLQKKWLLTETDGMTSSLSTHRNMLMTCRTRLLTADRYIRIRQEALHNLSRGNGGGKVKPN